MSKQGPDNILVAGIYWSGSGAVVDFLKGHPDCHTPAGEFTDFKREGRIASMLAAPSASQARSMARLQWLETLFGRLPRAYLREWLKSGKKTVALKDQVRHNRLKLAAISRYQRHLRDGGEAADPRVWHEWVRAMGQAYAPEQRAIVWNQPIWVGRHEHIWPAVFAPAKLVVVHRDPVDQFAEVVRQGKLGKDKSDPAFGGKVTEPVAYVLTGIATKLQALLDLHQKMDDSQLLSVSFEDFVVKHERERERLCAFLELPNTQRANAPFDPSVSRRNIGIGRTPAIEEMLKPHGALIDELNALRGRLPDHP